MRTSLVLDPVLGDLPLLLDAEHVARDLEAVWRSSCGRPVHVDRCRRIDTRYAPCAGCVATYELRDERPGAPLRQTIGVVEIDAAGSRARLYQHDPALPGLIAAADARTIAPRLRALAAVEGCAVTPVHYKPGQSCVLSYSGARPPLLGKLGAGLDRTHAQRLRALRDDAAAHPLMPRILAPMAYWPDLGLLIQLKVSAAVDLTTTAFDGAAGQTRASLLRAVGSGIATLHKRVTVSGPQRRIDDDLTGLRRYETLFRHLMPDLAAKFAVVVSQLATTAADREEQDPVASHGALRTGQFLVGDDGALTLIDLDGFCWANPARDIGNLLAYLDWRAIRRPDEADAVAEARAEFLDGYSSVMSIDTRWLSVYRAAAMLKIAGRRLRRLDFEDWPLLGDLVEAAHASGHVDQAAAAAHRRAAAAN